MRWTNKAGYCLLLIAVSGLSAAPVNAGQASASFNVTATLQSANSSATATPTPTTGFCTMNTGSGSFGATVTIVCATGEVTGIAATGTSSSSLRSINGGAYLFGNLAGDGSGYGLLRAPGAGETSGDESGDGRIFGRIDNYTGAGTVTSWRTVTLPEWDYIEMQLGW